MTIWSVHYRYDLFVSRLSLKWPPVNLDYSERTRVVLTVSRLLTFLERGHWKQYDGCLWDAVRSDGDRFQKYSLRSVESESVSVKEILQNCRFCESKIVPSCWKMLRFLRLPESKYNGKSLDDPKIHKNAK